MYFPNNFYFCYLKSVMIYQFIKSCTIAIYPLSQTYTFLSNIRQWKSPMAYLFYKFIIMTERNQQLRNHQIVAKQAYLRQNISQEKYEDFAQFCESIAGNIDIEAWSVDYVRQLVTKFKVQEERKERKKKNGPSFHMYQTGDSTEMKTVSQKVKEEGEKHSKNEKGSIESEKGKSAERGKEKEEKSALEVLDSIFQNHLPTTQYESKKYDKSFFESCKFWEVPVTQQPTIKQKSTPPRSNLNKQANNFASNKFPLPAENFEKIFQTGINFPEAKNQIKQKSPKKKEFVQIPMDDELPKVQPRNKNNNRNTTSISNISNISNETRNQKKREIKLVSVKNLKNAKSSKIPYEGQILIREPFKDTVSCFKSFVRHALSVENLKIEIKEHEIISRSFFSGDYPMYHVKVMPSNIICKRNFQDFQKLRKNLENVYPGVRLPYLEKLGWLQSEVSPQYITKQKKYLTYFLQDVLQHNELKNSRILEDFLTLKDHKQMKRKFEEYDKIKKITSIEELCLLDGEVKVEISEVTRQYNQCFQTFLNKLKNFWTNQQRIIAEINQMHLRLADNYKQLRQIIEQINKQTKDFNKRVNINQVQYLEDSFLNLSNYVNENIKVNEKESEFLQNQILVYLKYEKENMNMFDPVVNTRNNLTKCYLKRKDGEKGSDNVEFLSQRLKDYKVDILEESKSITVLKYQCGYINNLEANEAQRYCKFLSDKMEKMISNVCYEKLSYLSNAINTYTSLVYS